MESNNEQTWPQGGEGLDLGVSMPNEFEDLTNIFDFGEIDLGDVSGSLEAGQNASAGGIGEDFMLDTSFDLSQDMAQSSPQQHNRQTPVSSGYGPKQLFQHQMPQQFQTQHMQNQGQPPHHYQHGQHVPPTPNSFEMHGEAMQFLQQQQNLPVQQYQIRKDDAIAFTPMVSPAGTPQYNVQSEFTVPGAYFSPLTSPMLHAQQQQQQQRHQRQHGYYTNPSTAPSSHAPSPNDLNMDADMTGDAISLHTPANGQTRKTRRKVATPRSTGAPSRSNASPAQKSQKRKSGVLAAPGGHELPDAPSLPNSAGLRMLPGSSSETDSTSPEPLSEAIMGPPPRPGSSSTQYPSIIALRQDLRNEIRGPAATPKSLLASKAAQQSIKQSPSSGSDISYIPENGQLDDLSLPAAASTKAQKPALSRISTQSQPTTSAEQTPRMIARKTPKLGPESTPSSARRASAVTSPDAAMSPQSATTPGALLSSKKLEGKAGRGGRKRGSMSTSSSTVVSPALRPRISPSIKPLLPEGSTLHSSTHALLLASKSNYQNLLEGNHLPGVSYPESLSTGLTSKRTSHKVAEQGRRNRINEALKEMQLLLPKSTASKNCKDGGAGGTSPEEAADAEDGSKESKEAAEAKSSSSKASTVESANEYIRRLQRENADLLEFKKKYDEMRLQGADTLSEPATTLSESSKSD